MYVVVHEGEHYVGETEAGVQFLKDCGTYVPYSFLGYLSAKELGTYIIFVWYQEYVIEGGERVSYFQYTPLKLKCKVT